MTMYVAYFFLSKYVCTYLIGVVGLMYVKRKAGQEEDEDKRACIFL